MKLTAYRLLAGILGALFIAGGLMLFAAFFGYQQPGAAAAIPTGPVGHYFVAFTGCAMVGWGGGLLGAARHPAAAQHLGGHAQVGQLGAGAGADVGTVDRDRPDLADRCRIGRCGYRQAGIYRQHCRWQDAGQAVGGHWQAAWTGTGW